MSLFNRPSWAQVSPAGNDQETEKGIFSHAERVYQSIAADEQRKRRSSSKKSKAPSRKDISPEVIKPEKKEMVGSVKRRRITAEESRGLLDEMGFGRLSPDASTVSPIKESLPALALRTSPRKEETRFQEAGSSERQVSSADVIEIASDSEPEEVACQIPTKPRRDPIAPESEDEESDPEIAKLKRQARMRLLKPDPKPTMSNPRQATASINQPPTSSSHDPAIKLLITSPIHNTTPLLVIRKLGQGLQEVKNAWCTRQNFTPEFAKGVFLIHRMHRIYNATTCRGLGLDVDEDGAVIRKGAEDKDGVDKVHVEAVTEEIFQEMKAQHDKQERIRLGLELVGAEVGESAKNENADSSRDERQNIRIVLRTRDKNELKLKVQPTTVFSKVIQACRNTWSIPNDRTISLDFDGETLDPASEVGDSELEDMMTIDVYIT